MEGMAVLYMYCKGVHVSIDSIPCKGCILLSLRPGQILAVHTRLRTQYSFYESVGVTHNTIDYRIGLHVSKMAFGCQPI